MRERHFDGTHFKPRKVLENAHAVPKDGSPTCLLHVEDPARQACVGPLVKDGGTCHRLESVEAYPLRVRAKESHKWPRGQ